MFINVNLRYVATGETAGVVHEDMEKHEAKEKVREREDTEHVTKT